MNAVTKRRTVAETVGAEPVDESSIRRFVEAHEMGAERFSRADVPWSCLPMLSMPAYWSPGDAPRSQPVLPPLPWDAAGTWGSETLTNRFRYEFHRRPCRGDRVHTEYVLTGTTDKQTSIGPGTFVHFELRFTDQDGDLLAIEHTSVLHFTPTPVGASPSPAGPTVDDRGPVPLRAAGARPWSEGSQLGEVRLDLDLQRLVMVAGATRDFAPAHIDPEAARAGGAPDAYADVMFVMTMFERVLSETPGLVGCEPRGLAIELLDFVLCGHECVTRGEVVETTSNGDALRVSLELRQGARVCATAIADLDPDAGEAGGGR